MSSSRLPYEINVPSKRDPTRETSLNVADNLERELQKIDFTKWGFVIYRCTYQSQEDWDKFMDMLLYTVTDYFEFHKGLDMLESFCPTVFEDPSFDGATTAHLRTHFRKWVETAKRQEQGIDTLYTSGRYIFFVMVDQEALESVLNSDPEAMITTGFVRLVYGDWEPEANEDGENEDLEPIEGCTQEDVGWMKIPYDEVQSIGAGGLAMRDMHDWDMYYARPPEVQALG